MKYLIGFVVGVFSTLLVMTVLQKTKKKDATSSGSNTDYGVDNFDAFYKRFHSDSVFQMEHVLFPLKGLPANADSLTVLEDNFNWEQSEWKMHKPFDTDDPAFQIEVQAITPDLYQEVIYHKISGYAMLRKFAKVEKDWYLIYYSGMNEVD